MLIVALFCVVEIPSFNLCSHFPRKILLIIQQLNICSAPLIINSLNGLRDNIYILRLIFIGS